MKAGRIKRSGCQYNFPADRKEMFSSGPTGPGSGKGSRSTLPFSSKPSGVKKGSWSLPECDRNGEMASTEPNRRSHTYFHLPAARLSRDQAATDRSHYCQSAKIGSFASISVSPEPGAMDPLEYGEYRESRILMRECVKS